MGSTMRSTSILALLRQTKVRATDFGTGTDKSWHRPINDLYFILAPSWHILEHPGTHCNSYILSAAVGKPLPKSAALHIKQRVASAAALEHFCVHDLFSLMRYVIRLIQQHSQEAWRSTYRPISRCTDNKRKPQENWAKR